ncbi:MAG: ATP-dependent zinc protease [Candidatus Omnitrophota bacterium]|jgi:hypothetical protein|nr:MAG: ATP-dependent zinc protease [Candidatus Omnitrophota bacterium]
MKEEKSKKPQILIGWTESVDFPEWNIRDVKAKVDTGARTSALHVENPEKLPNGIVRFFVVLSRKNPDNRIEIHAPIVKEARVRSSTGKYTTRCFVKTRIRIGPVEKEIELSLVSREKMIFRMLLGRKALEKDFIVDVSKKHVMGKKAYMKDKKINP